MYISSDGCLTHSWSCLGCSACFLPECNWLSGERKAFSKILRKLADFMMIHNQPCQGHFSSDNLLMLKFFGAILISWKKKKTNDWPFTPSQSICSSYHPKLIILEPVIYENERNVIVKTRIGTEDRITLAHLFFFFFFFSISAPLKTFWAAATAQADVQSAISSRSKKRKCFTSLSIASYPHPFQCAYLVYPSSHLWYPFTASGMLHWRCLRVWREWWEESKSKNVDEGSRANLKDGLDTLLRIPWVGQLGLKKKSGQGAQLKKN